MNNHYSKQCHGKKAFANPDNAEGEIRRSHKMAVNPRVVKYFCPWCQKWHVGHAKPARSERKRRKAMKAL